MNNVYDFNNYILKKCKLIPSFYIHDLQVIYYWMVIYMMMTF